GDLEKVYYDDNQPTFDREKTDVVQLQIGFITHIVCPTVSDYLNNLNGSVCTSPFKDSGA
ncbi:unnamed protein product, partial [Rotaria socialis]